MVPHSSSSRHAARPRRRPRTGDGPGCAAGQGRVGGRPGRGDRRIAARRGRWWHGDLHASRGGLVQCRRADRLQARRPRGGARRQRCHRRGPVHDELGPPGLPRAPGRDGRARPRRGPSSHERDAGDVLDTLGVVAPVRPAHRRHPRHRCDARWRLRREAAHRRSAGRRRDAPAQASRPGRTHPARGFPDEQPGSGRDPPPDRRRDTRRTTARPPGAAAVRDRRVLRGQHRRHRRHPDDRPVPLGRSRGRGIRRRDQPGRDRGIPGARRTAGDVRAGTDPGRAGRPARPRPHRTPAAERRRGR